MDFLEILKYSIKFVFFPDDITDMEVYSYIGASAAKQAGRPVKISYPKVKIAKKTNYSNFVLQDVDSDRQKSDNAALNTGAAFFLLVIAACVAIPLGMFRYYSLGETLSEPFGSEEIFMENGAMIDSALENFALGNIAQNSFVDENGNVFSADEVALTIGDVGIADAVSFTNYTVRSGDTIDRITYRFGLKNISTLISVNNIANVRVMKAGQKLRIPSMDGLIYKVAAGDTLNAVADKYKISVEKLLDVNDLSSGTLSTGMELFIPGAKMDSTSLRNAMGELFIYPIPIGEFRFSSYFGARKDPITNVSSFHYGVDLAAPKGTPIKASRSGRVSIVGYSNIYGNYVVIDHGNGYQTLYGHMSKALAKKGREVAQGERIGLVGSTGYSTGNHLHFTVYKNGTRVDPLTVLKKK